MPWLFICQVTDTSSWSKIIWGVQFSFMVILWINLHFSTVSAVYNEWLTSSDPMSFQPSTVPRSSTWMNRKKHLSVDKWELLLARRSKASASNERHVVFAMKRDKKPGRRTFSSMWRLWTKSGLGRETNSSWLFLILAGESQRQCLQTGHDYLLPHSSKPTIILWDFRFSQRWH